MRAWDFPIKASQKGDSDSPVPRSLILVKAKDMACAKLNSTSPLNRRVFLITQNALMKAQECRENALNCYRLSQTTSSGDDRQALLTLMMRWQQLAEQIDQVNSANEFDTGQFPVPGAFYANAETSSEVRHQARARSYH